MQSVAAPMGEFDDCSCTWFPLVDVGVQRQIAEGVNHVTVVWYTEIRDLYEGNTCHTLGQPDTRRPTFCSCSTEPVHDSAANTHYPGPLGGLGAAVLDVRIISGRTASNNVLNLSLHTEWTASEQLPSPSSERCPTVRLERERERESDRVLYWLANNIFTQMFMQ